VKNKSRHLCHANESVNPKSNFMINCSLAYLYMISAEQSRFSTLVQLARSLPTSSQCMLKPLLLSSSQQTCSGIKAHTSQSCRVDVSFCDVCQNLCGQIMDMCIWDLSQKWGTTCAMHCSSGASNSCAHVVMTPAKASCWLTVTYGGRCMVGLDTSPRHCPF
jgi:hypothetical protein